MMMMIYFSYIYIYIYFTLRQLFVSKLALFPTKIELNALKILELENKHSKTSENNLQKIYLLERLKE